MDTDRKKNNNRKKLADDLDSFFLKFQSVQLKILLLLVLEFTYQDCDWNVFTWSQVMFNAIFVMLNFIACHYLLRCCSYIKLPTCKVYWKFSEQRTHCVELTRTASFPLPSVCVWLRAPFAVWSRLICCCSSSSTLGLQQWNQVMLYYHGCCLLISLQHVCASVCVCRGVCSHLCLFLPDWLWHWAMASFCFAVSVCWG